MYDFSLITFPFQVVSVIGVACIPVFAIMALLFLKITFVGVGVSLYIFMQWIPAVNPVCRC